MNSALSLSAHQISGNRRPYRRMPLYLLRADGTGLTRVADRPLLCQQRLVNPGRMPHATRVCEEHATTTIPTDSDPASGIISARSRFAQYKAGCSLVKSRSKWCGLPQIASAHAAITHLLTGTASQTGVIAGPISKRQRKRHGTPVPPEQSQYRTTDKSVLRFITRRK